jgi:hypothetical protein
VGVGDDAVLHVDNDERGVRAVGECGHAVTLEAAADIRVWPDRARDPHRVRRRARRRRQHGSS